MYADSEHRCFYASAMRAPNGSELKRTDRTKGRIDKKQGRTWLPGALSTAWKGNRRQRPERGQKKRSRAYQEERRDEGDDDENCGKGPTLSVSFLELLATCFRSGVSGLQLRARARVSAAAEGWQLLWFAGPSRSNK